MKKETGSESSPCVECVNPLKSLWKIRWNYETVEGITTFLEEDFVGKPTLKEVKEVIENWYNSQIDHKVVAEFSWRGYPVWLSQENQFNYKVAYDLASQMNGANLPLTVKLGEYEDKTPAYFTFENVEDFSDFYLSSAQYVQNTLTSGWGLKDSIDWKLYEEGLE